MWLSVPREDRDSSLDSPYTICLWCQIGKTHYKFCVLSSLINIPIEIQNPPKPGLELVHIYYSALNFRDVMTATGKITAEVVAEGRLNQECIQGLEFSGRDSNGRRLMGMVTSDAIATMIYGDPVMMWEIPDTWTLEDAATVPVVYGTAYLSLFLTGRMQKGDSVLIHAGSGGVGQAAITLALNAGCLVFTTVGTPEKRKFIKERFPQLTDRHIGNSRDTSFEELIMEETKGRGVDLVLNSLAEEKLQASIRCLARGGRFLEIGKFDLSRNNPLGMEVFLKGTSFHGITLEKLLGEYTDWKLCLNDMMAEGIKRGDIQPLSRTTYQFDEVEPAFRFMAAGKHIGKVLIKIRPEEEELITIPTPIYMKATPRFYCNSEKSYVVAGGLGGFGLELVDWLVIRGARRVVLVSRSGVRTGYQCTRTRLWRSYGVQLSISTADISTAEGAERVIEEALQLGPVGAIFNLAVVLHDAIFENQTEQMFEKSAAPKSAATRHLDRASRRLCPQLDHFVVFSSVSCGRGNPGQTNYGMSNSVMERVCEERVRDGLPGLAVQWGAVGEVGLVADMQEEQHELVIGEYSPRTYPSLYLFPKLQLGKPPAQNFLYLITHELEVRSSHREDSCGVILAGGTLQQKISSCLEVLDQFLRQPHPVVASMVVAEKRAGFSGSKGIVDCVTNIMGIRDLKTVSLHSTLAELGMDSMMAVEIKQTLERDFEVFLTPQDVRGMTFARLAEIASAADSEVPAPQDETSAAHNISETEKFITEKLVYSTTCNWRADFIDIKLMMSIVGDEAFALMPIIELPSTIDPADTSAPVIIMIPGIEGMAHVLSPLANNLDYRTLSVQFKQDYNLKSISQLAEEHMQVIQEQTYVRLKFFRLQAFIKLISQNIFNVEIFENILLQNLKNLLKLNIYNNYCYMTQNVYFLFDLQVVMTHLVAERPFCIVGYSFGGVVAIELVSQLEAKGYSGKLVLVDSSPDYLMELSKSQLQMGSDDLMKMNLLLVIIGVIIPHSVKTIAKIQSDLEKIPTWIERMEYAVALDVHHNLKHSKEYLFSTVTALFARIRSILEYDFGITKRKITSETILVRPSSSGRTAEDDYGLSKETFLKTRKKKVSFKIFCKSYFKDLFTVDPGFETKM
ncbi:hypothetical protein PR048_013896, partial [Dryococelus australis]